MEQSKRIITNQSGSLEIDLYGGAITGFQLLNNKINPLSFRFSEAEMPANNRGGAPYQGHFLCAGRWGPPSPGEILQGLPDHGEAANIHWEICRADQQALEMQVDCKREGLHIYRTIRMESHSPVYHVRETITNTHSLGRLYNMVQHPTIAAPFLDEHTIVNCNAAQGFHYNAYREPGKNSRRWPWGMEEDGSLVNLSSSIGGNSAVFSFIVNPAEEHGWVTAYAPGTNLLFGYIWPRRDYPWINLWRDYKNGRIRFRGLEFGTTGIHQPFGEILSSNGLKLFGENVVEYIDAGESVSRSYLSFLIEVRAGFKGVEAIKLGQGSLIVKEKEGEEKLVGMENINE